MTQSGEEEQAHARLNAQALWNQTPCGVVDGRILDLEYFLRVEKRRYEETDPWLLRAIPFADYRGKKILEIGIGQGTDLVRFAQSGAICHGIDITDEHLQRTAENFRARGYSVELRKCDAVAISYPDNHFDLVYSIGVVHHIPEIERVLREVRRVLKPGAPFLGAVYRKYSAFHLFQKLLWEGLRFGALFRLGYKGLLATIERGADGVVIQPYIKLYTDRFLKKACSNAGLEVLTTSAYHLDKSHFGPLGPIFGTSFVSSDRLEKVLGWYLLVKAIKREGRGKRNSRKLRQQANGEFKGRPPEF